MKKITGAMALKMLEIVVEEIGHDHVYVNPKGQIAGTTDSCGVLAECHYLHTEDGETAAGCVVGHVAKRLGTPDRILLGEEGNTSTSLVEAIHADADVDLEFTDTASLVLRRAQSAQDEGHSWGEALEKAKKYYLEIKMSDFNPAEEEIMDKF